METVHSGLSFLILALHFFIFLPACWLTNLLMLATAVNLNYKPVLYPTSCRKHELASLTEGSYVFCVVCLPVSRTVKNLTT